MQPNIWDHEKILALFSLPFFELVNKAYGVHRQYDDNQTVEFSTLLSIKTGACPEDCAYCPQSGRYKTGIKKEKLLSIDTVLQQAREAKANGAQRFCMGAAWKSPPISDFPKVLDMIGEVKKFGLETCVTLGMLDAEQAEQLKQAGLDFYNHNLDTSENFYTSIITTRTYQDRLTTIQHVIDAGINVCCGGILGMGETREDRIQLLLTLYHLPVTPMSIPINQLIPIKGTPLESAEPLEPFEFIRTIAITRLMFPNTKIRLSAGRENMSDEMQAWCFMAGANSIFIGEKLLTAKNPDQDRDIQLLKKLSMPFPKVTVERRSCG
jgi:biotin synthase